MKEFDNEKFKRDMGLRPRVLQPYDFERYNKYNPKLTEPVYQHLRQNGSEWKILCGLSVTTHWGSVLLAEEWHLKWGECYKETDFYKWRYEWQNYISLDTW
jgi:hypothetical protein